MIALLSMLLFLQNTSIISQQSLSKDNSFTKQQNLFPVYPINTNQIFILYALLQRVRNKQGKFNNILGQKPRRQFNPS